MTNKALSLAGVIFLCLMSQATWAQSDAPLAVQQKVDGVDLSSDKVPDTIMFTIDELNEVQTRESGGQITGIQYRSGAIEDANLYLSSILFFDEREWMFWINGVAITPTFQVDTFEVVSIQPSHVELIVPLSAAGVRPVRLEPNQTFIGESGRVVEGAFN